MTRQSKLYEQFWRARVCECCGLSQISGLFNIKKPLCNIELMFSDESGPVSLTASSPQQLPAEPDQSWLAYVLFSS